MIDAHVDSAYIIDHMQWYDSDVQYRITSTVDSAYVADRAYLPISHLIDVDTEGAAVDDYLVFDGTYWRHQPADTIDADLLDYKGVVDVTENNPGCT